MLIAMLPNINFSLRSKQCIKRYAAILYVSTSTEASQISTCVTIFMRLNIYRTQSKQLPVVCVMLTMAI